MRRGLDAVVAILLVSCLACSRRPPSSVEPRVAAARPAENPWADAARDVLVVHCGRCHRSDVPAAPKAALAVFDLLNEDWYRGIRSAQYETMLDRVRGSEAIAPDERDAVERFVACAKDGACAPGEK